MYIQGNGGRGTGGVSQGVTTIFVLQGWWQGAGTEHFFILPGGGRVVAGWWQVGGRGGGAVPHFCTLGAWQGGG